MVGAIGVMTMVPPSCTVTLTRSPILSPVSARSAASKMRPCELPTLAMVLSILFARKTMFDQSDSTLRTPRAQVLPWCLLHPHVSPRRLANRRIPGSCGAHRRRRDRFARVRDEPVRPSRPPGAFMARRLGCPDIGIDVAAVGSLGRDAVKPVRMAGLRDDAGIVAAACQQEGDPGIGQQVELVDRPPRCHVVLLGADREQ